MSSVVFIDAKEEYIDSFWKAFDNVAAERKFLGTPRAFPIENVRGFIKRSIRYKIPYIFVLDESTDEIVGWCDLQPKDIETGSLGIGILKLYRNSGLGKMLIDEITKKGIEYGYKKIYLEVRKSNLHAIHIYEKVGFKKIGEIKEGVKFGNTRDDVIKMEKRII